MNKYCKAYLVRDLRYFAGWAAEGLDDETVIFIWDDYTVSETPFSDSTVIFNDVTTEWKEFCTTNLHFEVPEELQYAYKTE